MVAKENYSGSEQQWDARYNLAYQDGSRTSNRHVTICNADIVLEPNIVFKLCSPVSHARRQLKIGCSHARNTCSQ